MPIPVPDGVKISQEDGAFSVTGPKGTLSRTLPQLIEVKQVERDKS